MLQLSTPNTCPGSQSLVAPGLLSPHLALTKQIPQSKVPMALGIIALERVIPPLEMLLSQLPSPQDAVVIIRCDIGDLSLNPLLERRKTKL